MRKYLNGNSVPLSVAVFLATDNYDYEKDTISATKLMKPLRQLILAARVPPAQSMVDISGMLKSRMGTAIHDGIELAWLKNKEAALSALGYPPKVIERIRINPKPGSLKPEDIPVYLEQRSYKSVMGYTISGKFDFVAEGRVEDFKSTSTFSWTNTNKERDFQLQGSLYRWLNPEIITADEMGINFLFTDWQAARAKTDPNYPQCDTPQKRIPLLSIEETDHYVRTKLTDYERLKDAPESELPLCNDHELWRKPPQYKYYKNPQSRARSTKNFDTRQEAYERLAKDKHVGVVVEKPGDVIACKYCPAFPVCTQKDDLIADGSLVL